MFLIPERQGTIPYMILKLRSFILLGRKYGNMYRKYLFFGELKMKPKEPEIIPNLPSLSELQIKLRISP